MSRDLYVIVVGVSLYIFIVVGSIILWLFDELFDEFLFSTHFSLFSIFNVLFYWSPKFVYSKIPISCFFWCNAQSCFFYDFGMFNRKNNLCFRVLCLVFMGFSLSLTLYDSFSVATYRAPRYIILFLVVGVMGGGI